MTYEDIAERYPQEYALRKKDKLRYRYPSGESYLDLIDRVQSVLAQLQTCSEPLVIVAHQAVLRAIYGCLMRIPHDDIAELNMPLHTLIELTPMPDGSISEQRFAVDVHAGAGVADAKLQPSQCRVEAPASHAAIIQAKC